MCATCFETLSRRNFVAGAALAAGSALTAGTSLALADEASRANVDASSDTQAAADEGTATPVPTYSVSVYDFDGVRIHAFNTQDALGDVCYKAPTSSSASSCPRCRPPCSSGSATSPTSASR